MQQYRLPLIYAALVLSASVLLAPSVAGAAMEKSHWQERGMKPPPPIGTDGVIFRKPLDERQERCPPENVRIECEICPVASECEPRLLVPAEDRPER